MSSGFEFILWDENPSVMIKGNVKLSQLNYPAMTICSKGSTKYALAERLGNFINPQFELPEEFLLLQKEFWNCAISNEMKLYFNEWKKVKNEYNCLQPTELNQGCKVKYTLVHNTYSI